MPVNLIELALKRTKLKQTELAAKLGVSKVQISKWKNGDHVPSSRADQLLEMMGMTDQEYWWLPFASTDQDIGRWAHHAAGLQHEVFPFFEVLGMEERDVTPIVLEQMQKFSIIIPSHPPQDRVDDEGPEGFSLLLSTVLEHAGRLLFWMLRNMETYDDLMSSPLEVEHYSIGLALSHIDELEFAEHIKDISAFRTARHKVRTEIAKLLHAFCQELVSRNLPITTDYFTLINDKPEDMVDDDDAYAPFYHDIREYYSQPEKDILAQMNEMRDVVRELHYKVDCLLSDQAKAVLEPHIEITKPWLKVEGD